MSDQDWVALAEEMRDSIDGIEVSVGDNAIEVMGADSEWVESSDRISSAEDAVEEVLADHDGLDYRRQSVLETPNSESKRILIAIEDSLSETDPDEGLLEKELMGGGIWKYSCSVSSI